MLSSDSQNTIIRTMFKDNSLDAICEIFDTTGWPSAKALSPTIVLATQGWNLYPPSDNSDSEKPQPDHAFTPHFDQLWVNFFKKTNFTVGSLPEPVLCHLLAYKYNQALTQVLEVSQPPELEEWLNERTQHSYAENGRDKTTNLGALVMSGADQALDVVCQKIPSVVNLTDHRHRTPLFYARSKKMVRYWVAKGAKVDHKNKDGQTVAEVWTDVLKARNAHQWLGELPQTDPALQIAQKMSVFQMDGLSSPEQQWLKEKAQDPNYQWKGSLFGIEKEWSLAEMWDFSVVLNAFELTPSSKAELNNKSFYHYTRTKGRHRSLNVKGTFIVDPTTLETVTQQQESHLPQVLQKELKNPSFDRLPLWWLRSMDQKHAWDGTRKNLVGSFPPATNPYRKNEVYQTRMNHLVPLKNFVKNLSWDERRDFARALSSYVGATALWEHYIFGSRLLQSMEMFALPIEHEGILSTELTKVAAFLRLEEGIRSTDFAAQWSEVFLKTAKPLWEQDVKKGADLQVWGPVLQLGLSFSPLIKDLSEKVTDQVSEVLCNMLLQNVEIEKIPQRFSKHMPQNLQAAASRWIINKSLASKKDKEEEPTLPRRRM